MTETPRGRPPAPPLLREELPRKWWECGGTSARLATSDQASQGPLRASPALTVGCCGVSLRCCGVRLRCGPGGRGFESPHSPHSRTARHIAPERRPIPDEDPLESAPQIDSAGVYEGLRAEDLGYGDLPHATGPPAKRKGSAAVVYGVVAALVLVGLAWALFW